MSTLQFISDMASALAWPMLVAVVLVAFRRDLARWLADRPSKLRLGPLEAEWSRLASHVEADLDQAVVPPPAELATSGYLSEHLAEVAASAPLRAVAEAAGAIEERLRQALAHAGVDPGSVGLVGLGKIAEERGAIRPETAEAVRGLAIMRNLAVHGRDVSPARAEEFLALADATLFAVERDTREAGSPSGHPPPASGR